jgi:tRNA(Ile)-lysidine synthase
MLPRVDIVATHARVSPDPRDCLRRVAGLALPSGARVLLAVSGGGDSVALLAAAREVLGHALAVVHVRHGLRDDDGRDARLVEALCGEAGLPCRVVRSAPDPGPAGRSETAARRRRMAVLARAASDAGCPVVLTAHHDDDARETVLLHLLRGHRGDRALAGIPAVRRLGPACALVRPFVCGPRPPGREALARLREARGLPCVHDPSNADTGVARNALRAWLAGCDASFLAGLDAARHAARRRLGARVLAAAAALERGLRAEGLGARVERDAFGSCDAASAPHAHRAELLRLLSACLARPRRVDVRRPVLAALHAALDAGQGRVRIPAEPAPLDLVCSARAVHLPDERLAPGPATARVAEAVCAGSLHL